MALIICPECGRENVSDTAEACPECGYAVKEHFNKMKAEEKNQQTQAEPEITEESLPGKNIDDNVVLKSGVNKKRKKFLGIVIGVVIVCIVWCIWQWNQAEQIKVEYLNNVREWCHCLDSGDFFITADIDYAYKYMNHEYPEFSEDFVFTSIMSMHDFSDLDNGLESLQEAYKKVEELPDAIMFTDLKMYEELHKEVCLAQKQITQMVKKLKDWKNKDFEQWLEEVDAKGDEYSDTYDKIFKQYEKCYLKSKLHDGKSYFDVNTYLLDRE